MSKAVCKCCHTDISRRDVVIAAGGYIFCGKDCTVAHLMSSNHQSRAEALSTYRIIAEEVDTESIGIKEVNIAKIKATRKTCTLPQALANYDLGLLLSIWEELNSGVVPASGCAHTTLRKLNRLIEKGELQINPTEYRKIYLPTFAKAVYREMACRYASYLKGSTCIVTDEI